jgi:ribosomal protein S12 methylthiotransferase accessory factor
LTRAGYGSPVRPVRPESIVDAGPGMLMERFRAAGVEVDITSLDNAYGIPTFKVAIWSGAFPRIFKGIGTHLDAAVALSRALTEAAQSRATAIAGARDDIGRLTYVEGTAFGMRRSAAGTVPGQHGFPPVPFDSISSLRLPDTDAELVLVTRLIHEVTGHPPLYVDLTRTDIAIPVAHVVCPGTVFDAVH